MNDRPPPRVPDPPVGSQPINCLDCDRDDPQCVHCHGEGRICRGCYEPLSKCRCDFDRSFRAKF